MYSVEDIANWFLYSIDRESGDSITHLKLQKLVYYAQAWSLALCDKSLFEEDFQAWAHGPVVRSLYEIYKDSSWNALDLPDKPLIEFDAETEELLNDVWKIYGQHSAKYLEELTHSEDPWIITRGDLSPEERSEEIISRELITAYYQGVYKQLNG